VLHFWAEAVREGKISIKTGLPLVHIDTHSDGAVPAFPHSYKKLTITDPIDAEELIKYSNVGDFIPLAQYMGMINGNVIWIQSNWPGEDYNMGLGTSAALLGHRNSFDELGKKPFLCMNNFESISARDFPGARAGLSTTLQELSDKAILCDDNDMSENPLRVQWDVFHLSETIESQSNTQKQFMDIIGNSQYVLDIDEDFFSAKDPTIHRLLRFSEYSAYSALLEKIFSPEEICTKDPNILSALNDLVYSMFYGDVMFLPPANTNDEPAPLPPREEFANPKHYEVLSAWCAGHQYAYNRLIIVTKLATLMLQNMNYVALAIIGNKKDFFKFPTLDKSCHVNGFFGVCSAGDPVREHEDRSVIDAQIDKIGIMISQLPSKPALITIARSLDGYTPYHLHPYIERRLLYMLDKVLAEKLEVVYYKNLKPAPQSGDLRRPTGRNTEKYDRLRFTINRMTRSYLEKMIDMRKRVHQDINIVLSFLHKTGLDSEQFVKQFTKGFMKYKKAVHDKLSNPRIISEKERDTKICYHIVGIKYSKDMDLLKCWLNRITDLVDNTTTYVDVVWDELEPYEYEHFLRIEKKDMVSWILDPVNREKAMEHSTNPFVIMRPGCTIDLTRYIGTTESTKDILFERYRAVTAQIIEEGSCKV
jgi:hypothetical protein